jgi:two-component system, LytTR family, response regulator
MNCIAIDDEPKALDIIELYVNKTPALDFSARFVDALKALDYVQNNNIDLIFLDINMPDISGIDFLKTLTRQPMVIFTTAYAEYALESYEFQTVDYLIKPILFNRFLKAVNRAKELFELRNSKSTPGKDRGASTKEDHLFVKSGNELHKILFSDILFIEGARNYITFYTAAKKIMSLMTMKETEETLPQNKFARIHKSVIVSLPKIEKVKDNHVFIADKRLSIGAIYKNEFLKKLK